MNSEPNSSIKISATKEAITLISELTSESIWLLLFVCVIMLFYYKFTTDK